MDHELEVEEASEERDLSSYNDSKHRISVLVTFLVAVNKYSTRSNLRKEGCILTHSLII